MSEKILSEIVDERARSRSMSGYIDPYESQFGKELKVILEKVLKGPDPNTSFIAQDYYKTSVELEFLNLLNHTLADVADDELRRTILRALQAIWKEGGCEWVLLQQLAEKGSFLENHYFVFCQGDISLK